MHDVHTLERDYGVAAVGIVSTGFATQAIYQAEALGLANADKHIVLASHPISDATGAELADKADGLYSDLIRQLTTNGPTSVARRRRLRSAVPSAECQAGA